MDLDIVKTALKRCELFEGLDEGQMGVLVMRASSREFCAGETVYERGDDSGGTFALIGSGKISVVAQNGFVLNELGVGEIIGEVGVITQQDKRTVTIKTIEPTEILEWHVKDVEEGSPEFLKRLKELAWKRMKYWNE
ncbi:MAG: cyclic nucleotide-binding domain-containing protein [Desulfobacteraceae bacterium]|uniref:Cyclic nucleotide-binding domain-containing protein n=1 Tax=Candidatus Desulfacyla euxinica TaxID=2841693 RepID=A0A8J6N0G9_9DELT|nr:cyclic nucleotide-binding domain-containing protein [Candidatus Desulfacyla euxinica]MBL6977675.1 cyclic nucleotide-binding domain-containing protein [Desulfobacteraceae bacterium]